MFGDGPADFSEFFHEVVLRMNAPGGVTDEEVDIFFDGLFVCFEADGGGIGVWCAGDDGDFEAGAPALELIYGCGAEGIGCGEADRVAAIFEPKAEFCGGCGFSGAVDTYD